MFASGACVKLNLKIAVPLFLVALALGAVACWTWYPIRNARWLRAHPQHSARAWATAQGLATLPLSLKWIGGQAGEGGEAVVEGGEVGVGLAQLPSRANNVCALGSVPLIPILVPARPHGPQVHPVQAFDKRADLFLPS